MTRKLSLGVLAALVLVVPALLAGGLSAQTPPSGTTPTPGTPMLPGATPGVGQEAGPELGVVELREIGGSGFFGTAFFSQREEGRTLVVATISNLMAGPISQAPAGVNHAVMLAGDCDDVTGFVQNVGHVNPVNLPALEDITGRSAGDISQGRGIFAAMAEVEEGLDLVLGSGYAIAVLDDQVDESILQPGATDDDLQTISDQMLVCGEVTPFAELHPLVHGIPDAPFVTPEPTPLR